MPYNLSFTPRIIKSCGGVVMGTVVSLKYDL